MFSVFAERVVGHRVTLHPVRTIVVAALVLVISAGLVALGRWTAPTAPTSASSASPIRNTCGPTTPTHRMPAGTQGNAFRRSGRYGVWHDRTLGHAVGSVPARARADLPRRRALSEARSERKDGARPAEAGARPVWLLNAMPLIIPDGAKGGAERCGVDRARGGAGLTRGLPRRGPHRPLRLSSSPVSRVSARPLFLKPRSLRCGRGSRACSSVAVFRPRWDSRSRDYRSCWRTRSGRSSARSPRRVAERSRSRCSWPSRRTIRRRHTRSGLRSSTCYASWRSGARCWSPSTTCNGSTPRPPARFRSRCGACGASGSASSRRCARRRASRCQSRLERTFPEGRLTRLTLGPLGVGALHRLLKSRLGLELARPELALVQGGERRQPAVRA